MEPTKINIGLDNPIFAGRLKSSLFEPFAKEKEEPKHYDSGDILQPTHSKVNNVIADLPSNTQPVIEPICFQFEDIDNSTYRPTIHRYRPKKVKHAIVSNLLIFLALCLLLLGTSVAVKDMKTNAKINKSLSSASASSAVSEKQPTPVDINNYRVAPTMPRFLEIPTLGIKARILRLGQKTDGEMATPANVFDTGWYSQSTLPGSGAGSSVIDGHVSGPTVPGVFFNLNKLQNGDIITIERGDGQKLNYKVIASEVAAPDKLDMARVMVSRNTAKAGLNLITCTGQVIGNEYTQRLVVYSVAT